MDHWRGLDSQPSWLYFRNTENISSELRHLNHFKSRFKLTHSGFKTKLDDLFIIIHSLIQTSFTTTSQDLKKKFLLFFQSSNNEIISYCILGLNFHLNQALKLTLNLNPLIAASPSYLLSFPELNPTPTFFFRFFNTFPGVPLMVVSQTCPQEDLIDFNFLKRFSSFRSGFLKRLSSLNLFSRSLMGSSGLFESHWKICIDLSWM